MPSSGFNAAGRRFFLRIGAARLLFKACKPAVSARQIPDFCKSFDLAGCFG
jgi:hypothetical protein